MDKGVIKTIIGQKQAEIQRTKLLKREIYFDEHTNYVLVGIRRAGKSYMLYQDILQHIAEGRNTIEDILYINFEDERIASIKAEELGLILDAYQEMFDRKQPRIYLDEIQNVKGWEKFARRLAEAKYHVMITGSNAKMLSHEIATSLGASYVPRIIDPFTFEEYLQYNGIRLDKNWEYNPDMRLAVVRHFEEYFHFGGFAEAFDKTDKREWINSLYQKIMMGDIVERNGIRNSRVFRLLARKLAESVMQPCTLGRLQHIIKSTGDTISLPILKDYLEYMEQAFLIFSLPNLTSPLTEQMTTMKRYWADNSLLNNFLTQGDTKLLENLVAIHLNHTYRNTPEDLRLFYYNKGVEVDFCIPEANMAVQVSYSIDNADTYEREVGGLAKFLKAYPTYQGFIVTYDEERHLAVDGTDIEVVPIWKWLFMQF